MKSVKKLLGFVLIVMLLFQTAGIAMADPLEKLDKDILMTGQCGRSVYFVLKGDTLYITGKEEMADITLDEHYHVDPFWTEHVNKLKHDFPWNVYSEKIKHVVIGKGVTDIGYNALLLNNLETVYMPTTIKEIWENNFHYMQTIYYGGSEKKFRKIKMFDEEKEYLKNKKIVYHSAQPSVVTVDYKSILKNSPWNKKGNKWTYTISKGNLAKGWTSIDGFKLNFNKKGTWIPYNNEEESLAASKSASPSEPPPTLPPSEITQIADTSSIFRPILNLDKDVRMTGKCGPSLSFVLKGDTLYFTGSGTFSYEKYSTYVDPFWIKPAANLDNYFEPWVIYGDYIKHVVFDEGVTVVSSDLFTFLSKVERVYIPSKTKIEINLHNFDVYFEHLYFGGSKEQFKDMGLSEKDVANIIYNVVPPQIDKIDYNLILQNTSWVKSGDDWSLRLADNTLAKGWVNIKDNLIYFNENGVWVPFSYPNNVVPNQSMDFISENYIREVQNNADTPIETD